MHGRHGYPVRAVGGATRGCLPFLFRLPRAAACVALRALAGMQLCHAAPANAQTEIRSATMTVGGSH